MLSAKIKLTMPSVLGGRFKPLPLSRASAALKKTIEQATPTLPAYERLGAVYHEYGRSFCPDYATFLNALTRKHRITCRSVLDLACGAGTLSTRLRACASRVIGLDVSETMLGAARHLCRDQPNVQFVHADYREFQLSERFDAVVCASDSLNYLHEPEELSQVLRSVARHLHRPGLFVFDALDDRGLRHYSNRFIPIEIDGTKCTIVLLYDTEKRVQNALAVFDNGVELHRRIPIEPADVIAAARRFGFTVVDWFSLAAFGLLRYGGIRNFYVLAARE